jgi:hypothetical protein
MDSIFRNITFTLMAAIMLCLSGGINITKMHCAKGSKVFLGVENSTCQLQQSDACTQTKSSCCKTKTTKTKNKLPCNKQTIEFSYDFDSIISSVYNVESTIELSTQVKNQFAHKTPLTLKRFTQTYLKDKSPPLVSKPILSQIQSFLI